jgi:hypothetical protein
MDLQLLKQKLQAVQQNLTSLVQQDKFVSYYTLLEIVNDVILKINSG